VASPGPSEFRPRPILETLVAHEVDFVLIGGMAGMARGSSFPSYDVDIACARSRENLERVAAALRELKATLRGAPPGLSFRLDAETLEGGANFTFDTRYGSLDILSYIVGAPGYKALKQAGGEPVEVESVRIVVASLDHLIAMKEAAGRPKDKLMATEYRVLSDELRAPRPDPPS
jgi:hypothetical protein